MQNNVHCECILCLTFNGIFHRNRANPLNIRVEAVKASSEVRTGWRHLMLWLQTMSWSCNHQNSAGLTRAQTRRAGYVTELKLILLTAQQANKLGEKVLEQGIIILIGKLADQEKGRLATWSIFSQTQFGLFLYPRGGVGAPCNADQWLFGTAAPPAPALLQLYYFRWW